MTCLTERHTFGANRAASRSTQCCGDNLANARQQVDKISRIMRPRLFSSKVTPAQRRLYRSVLVFFVLIFLAMIWPVVTLFSHARPLVLGLPFFLFYLAALLVGSFLVLLSLYLWESRTGSSSDPGGDSF